MKIDTDMHVPPPLDPKAILADEVVFTTGEGDTVTLHQAQLMATFSESDNLYGRWWWLGPELPTLHHYALVRLNPRPDGVVATIHAPESTPIYDAMKGEPR